MAEFIRTCVERGRYRDAGEVVSAGLRLLEQLEQEDETRVELLRRLTRESIRGFEDGQFTSYSSDALDQLFARIDNGIREKMDQQ